MFRKPKNRNIRQRQRNDSDEEESPTKVESLQPKENKEEDDNDDEVQPSIPMVKKPIQLVSFDQDEDNDVEFKIKKPSRKRAEKLLKKQREYEKKQKEFEEAKKYDIEKDLGLVIKNPIVGKSGIENVDEEHVEEDPVIIEAVKESMESTSTMVMGIDGIPDAKTVYEMKKKREQMRREGIRAQDDSFIPLESSSTSKEKVVHSRLVREDDNDMSDEDGENTKQFISAKSLLITDEERIRKEQEEIVLGDSDDDEDKDENDEEAKRKAQESDEEFAMWERDQLRKAVSKKRVNQMRNENYAVTNEQPEIITVEDDDMDIEIDTTSQNIAKNIPTLSNLSLTNITDKLKLRIEDKKNNINFEEIDLIRKKNTIEENDKMIQGIELDYPKLREKYRLYQEMKIYTKDLLDCINEKLDVVVNMESKIMNMWKTRSEKLIKRRREDVTDQNNKCIALSKGRQWQPDSETSQRETNRESRRSYRRIQREKVGIQQSHQDGMSSDEDEANSDTFEYQKTISEALENAAYVFHDASEEFSDVGLIMSKYADWILIEPKTFEDAFIGLCLPKLLSPFIRLELLDWNPLKDVSKPMFMFDWYKKLLTIGTDKVGFDLEYPVIVDLIPNIIDKLIIPRLTKITIEQWDPYSLSQSRNLSYIINLFVDENPTLTPDSKNVKNLLKAIFDKLKAAVDHDCDIPVFGKDALQNSSTGCSLFLNRRFWSIIKLIKSANCFNNILSKTYLQEIILDGFINRSIVLMLHFLKDFPTTIHKCLAVIDEIPNEWLINSDSKKFSSLVNALKNVSNAHPDVSERKRIVKFINKVEN